MERMGTSIDNRAIRITASKFGILGGVRSAQAFTRCAATRPGRVVARIPGSPARALLGHR
jgi:hypothetical protein